MSGLAILHISLLRYFHTLRYLRPIQVYGRLWHGVYQPHADMRLAPALRDTNGVWQLGCHRSSLMLDSTTFRFLNITGSLRTAADWDDPTRLRLWRYNLHYFDDLNAKGAGARVDWHRSLIARWISENPPRVGTGWEPYPISLRIVNWIKWEFARKLRGEPALDRKALNSLAVQTRWLLKKLDIHLLGNHLWANAKALVFAGAFFAGPEAKSWLCKGLSILERELSEQILPDGGHFERSPMYHAILLEDILDMINLSHVATQCFSPWFVARLYATATLMLHWLRVMTHPDGQIALFNDAAFGIASDYTAIAEYAQRLSVSVDQRALSTIEVLPDSGYVRLQNERAVVICDAAPIGPDYLPGHAHADTLSFELSLDGQRVLVNGGTSTYELGAARQKQRGTAAHNTIVVDGQDSSEVWGGFRVARRARPFGVSWGEEEGSVWLEASHDGYLRLTGRVIHLRRWVLEPDGLSIEDRLTGRFGNAYAVFHLHPGVTAQIIEQSNSVVLLPPGKNPKVRLLFEPPIEIYLKQSTWHPEFGQSVNSTMLTVRFQSESLLTRLSW